MTLLRMKYRDTHEFEDMLIREIADDYEHGATALATNALGLIPRFVTDAVVDRPDDMQRSLDRFIDRLARSRPSIVAIERVLRDWQAQFTAPDTVDALNAEVKLVTKRTLQKIERATEQTLRLSAAALSTCETLMTHSASSAVRGSIEILGRDNIQVFATESLPGGEGKSLSNMLATWGFRCVVIADRDAIDVVRIADVFVVGADAILPNGDLVNKVGTFAIAEAANKHDVPVLVIAESFKNATAPVRLETVPGSDEPMFDITPACLVTRRIGDDLFSA